MIYKISRVKRFRIAGLILAGSMCVFPIFGQNEDEVQTRQIIPVFEKARRKASTAIRGNNFQAKRTIKARIRVAQRSNSGLAQSIVQTKRKVSPQKLGMVKTKVNRMPAPSKVETASLAKSQKIGLTVWRMEPENNSTAANDPKATRDLVHPVGGLVPTRVSAESIFREGEKIRLSIESPTDGYLYVLNCEVYEDDTRGKLSLIFPTTRTRGGNNFLTAGSPIEFPSASDVPGYFEFRPQAKVKKVAAEALIFMVTKTPIENFTPQENPLIVDYERFEKWEKKWSGKLQIWESESELSKPYTRAEFESASETRTRGISSDGRLLKPNEPEPQTLFAIETKTDEGLLFTLLLRYL